MAKRKVLQAGMPRHRNPIPAAVKIGQMVFSSAIGGQDPQTHQTPPEPERQVALAFQSVRRLMEEAGGTTDDIGKMTVFLKDMKHRELVNQEWLKMFPDENNRPARHAIKADLPGEMVVQLEIVAVL